MEAQKSREELIDDGFEMRLKLFSLKVDGEMVTLLLNAVGVFISCFEIILLPRPDKDHGNGLLCGATVSIRGPDRGVIYILHASRTNIRQFSTIGFFR